MVWLNPAALALLALVPVLLVLHALRYRRRDVQVSTLFLWESVAREAQGSLGLRRLVQNLPLLLQILLVCLLAAALAEPALTGEAAPSRDVVLVLDVSASMQARGEQGTRFEQAREHALRLLQELPAGRQMAIITAGRQPRMASFFSGDKPLLRQALRDLQAGDGPGNMREALFLALSLTQGSGSREIVVIGDGAYRNASELAELRQQLGGQLRHIRVDGGETNVGITRFAFRQVPDTEGLYEVLLTVKNFSPQPVTAPLRLSLPPQGPLQRELRLQPGEEEVVVSTVAGPLRGVAEAELALEDDLELDNRAYGIAAARAETWILLVGQPNYFLETLLTSIPGVFVNVVPQVSPEILPRLVASNRLIIFNGVAPPPLQRGNFLLLNTVPPDDRVRHTGAVTQPRIVDWEHQHPLLQFVDLTDLQIAEALQLALRDGTHSLAAAPETPLLGLIEEPHLRVVVVGFDLMQSDLPLRVAFPVFIGNLLRWLAPPVSDGGGQVRAGTPYPLYLDSPLSHITVQDPEGRQRQYEVQGNPWIFTDTQRVGVYTLRAGDTFKRYLTVNLLDGRESDISAADRLAPLTPGDAAPPAPAGSAHTSLWLALTLGAVGILSAEWFAWCRDF
ncbi:MAG: VWA domain-containing protein [Candidatus Tectomicrobia bacterium]|nr:VWA domain-containing protein [Candidatus Tectomicrobia bacterium]